MFAAPVNSMCEAFSDPAVAQTEMVVELDTPVGPMKFFGVPYKLDTTPGQRALTSAAARPAHE